MDPAEPDVFLAFFDRTSESRKSCTSRLAAEAHAEQERIEQIKKRYNNTPLRRIIARQLSKEAAPIQSPFAPETKQEVSSLVDSVVSKEDATEGDSISQIKARYNDTPLRRILARQTSREITLIRPSPRPEKKTCIASPVDSVISEQDATELAQLTVSEHRQKRTEQWASDLDGDLQVLKTKGPFVKRSNTPLRRILERQVSTSLEKRLQWS
ncbi:hypothetical protein SLS60_003519 [Paraconiothyrium brasiliense]|uniref:Uncharacterized protein n=1 Tax=Paraconiothyrium brasiliense TaxID=300254 RepID=A0ABR3RVY9_9PLEO